MTKIMRIRCGLHHNMIEATKITEQIMILGTKQLHSDRPSNRSECA
jgi:hypothetical protein